jgi:hypothetical protein
VKADGQKKRITVVGSREKWDNKTVTIGAIDYTFSMVVKPMFYHSK